MIDPIVPAPSSVTSGARPAAAVNAVCMSLIAVVSMMGVGAAKFDANT